MSPRSPAPGPPTLLASATVHVAGLGLLIGGLAMLAAAAVELGDGGPDTGALAACGAGTAAAGGLAWRRSRLPERIGRTDVFASVAVTWLALAVAGALPFLVTGTMGRVDDALFESISGFTTTGATALRPIEDASAGLLMWRALTQWLGGMGVIVLVVAVLPTVGAGGMELLQAEAPGPTGERLTPRVRHTARRLWAVYLGLTVAVGAAYGLAGMSPYDAAAHSFTTVSTGGFSPHTASIAHFESAAIEWIAVVGMFAAGGSFALYYRLVRGRPGPLLRSVELRLYALVIAGTSLFAYLAQGDEAGYGAGALRAAVFSVTSVVTTTGFTTADFGGWTDATQVVLLLLMPVGAMAGSTAGGVKLVRILAVGSYATRELLRQLHPRIVRPVRIGAARMDEAVANRILGFLVLALVVFGTGVVAVALTGEDVVTSFSASASAFGNVGPGLGEVGPASDYQALAAPARGALMAVMLLGRLEIYPVLLALAALGAAARPTRGRPGRRAWPEDPRAAPSG